MITTLIVGAFALLSAAGSWTLAQFAHLDQISSALAGLILFLFLMQCRAARLRAREQEEIEDSFKDVRATNFAIQQALEDSKVKIAEVATALDKKTDAQEKKVTSELQIIERLIREFAGNIAAKSKNHPVPEAEAVERPAASGPSYAATLTDPAMLDLIRRSLEENRVDLYLQPIVSLPQRKVRFYEALTRLRSEDGRIIMPSQYIKVAAPAGLMSVVDNLLLFRCVQVMRRLTQKSREIAVFCNISGHTLSDAEFFPQFLDFMTHNRDIAGQIIFEFTQESIIGTGAVGEANLKALANLGFRFSLDQVVKLNGDFAKLKRLGFHFLKVRADMLISGMKHAHAPVAAEDFKDLLARNGLNLIVERIEDEKQVVQLLEYSVDFGQGYLFGQPRPIREISDVHDPRAREPKAANVTVLSASLARRLAS